MGDKLRLGEDYVLLQSFIKFVNVQSLDSKCPMQTYMDHFVTTNNNIHKVHLVETFDY